MDETTPETVDATSEQNTPAPINWSERVEQLQATLTESKARFMALVASGNVDDAWTLAATARQIEADLALAQIRLAGEWFPRTQNQYREYYRGSEELMALTVKLLGKARRIIVERSESDPEHLEFRFPAPGTHSAGGTGHSAPRNKIVYTGGKIGTEQIRIGKLYDMAANAGVREAIAAKSKDTAVNRSNAMNEPKTLKVVMDWANCERLELTPE